MAQFRDTAVVLVRLRLEERLVIDGSKELSEVLPKCALHGMLSVYLSGDPIWEDLGLNFGYEENYL